MLFVNLTDMETYLSLYDVFILEVQTRMKCFTILPHELQQQQQKYNVLYNNVSNVLEFLYLV